MLRLQFCQVPWVHGVSAWAKFPEERGEEKDLDYSRVLKCLTKMTSINSFLHYSWGGQIDRNKSFQFVSDSCILLDSQAGCSLFFQPQEAPACPWHFVTIRPNAGIEARLNSKQIGKMVTERSVRRFRLEPLTILDQPCAWLQESSGKGLTLSMLDPHKHIFASCPCSVQHLTPSQSLAAKLVAS